MFEIHDINKYDIYQTSYQKRHQKYIYIYVQYKKNVVQSKRKLKTAFNKDFLNKQYKTR